MKRAEALFRVERGHASEEELAALATVLLALRGSAQEGGEEPPIAGFHWWKQPEGYALPGSWR
ncbi:acyl-CoA carboxylase epsilon subunit [Streptomyces akebiae]|uniref:Acyl-CoA carboxylase subunit epsilon n=1 Tax=Streptomyces akebiae TaxID=2865673 RepID=A0ABX8Y5R4_9ACTN|nr:acyl-CoA carboxylase epsilon subunit [Streptomyces akebiae]QYX83581.1 acyl-CoA carboxylase subunit epsilon [Streptomyces akebiae]